jgi:endonuclease/exonuclease/phosphatase family metal-dependent hydrolase
LVIINTQLDAFHPKERHIQIKKILGTIDQLTSPYILCGDINAISSIEQSNAPFSDSPKLSYECQTIDMISKFFKFESSHYTFPSDCPNRQLDYIFASSPIQIDRISALNVTGCPSDHLPLMATISFQ